MIKFTISLLLTFIEMFWDINYTEMLMFDQQGLLYSSIFSGKKAALLSLFIQAIFHMVIVNV